MGYQLFHLKDNRSSTNLQLIGEILSQARTDSWGVFPSIFGLGTNELYWVLLSEQRTSPLAIEGVELIAQSTLQPTVRPKTHTAREKSGVYVFRWFEVEHQHVDEVVKLSDESWKTFEGGFDTEIQGLFTVSPEMKVSQVSCGMLLVTWYRDLSVWQDSRAPDPEARKRFVARQALLDSAVPIATRLEIGHV